MIYIHTQGHSFITWTCREVVWSQSAHLVIMNRMCLHQSLMLIPLDATRVLLRVHVVYLSRLVSLCTEMRTQKPKDWGIIMCTRSLLDHSYIEFDNSQKLTCVPNQNIARRVDFLISRRGSGFHWRQDGQRKGFRVLGGFNPKTLYCGGTTTKWRGQNFMIFEASSTTTDGVKHSGCGPM